MYANNSKGLIKFNSPVNMPGFHSQKQKNMKTQKITLGKFKKDRTAIALKLIASNELNRASRVLAHLATVEERYTHKGKNFELPENEILEMWHSYKKPFKSYYYNPSSGAVTVN